MNTYTIKAIGTDYAEIPTGNGFSDEDIARIIKQYDLERDGEQLVAEWGNGEGEDRYEIIPEQS